MDSWEKNAGCSAWAVLSPLYFPGCASTEWGAEACHMSLGCLRKGEEGGGVKAPPSRNSRPTYWPGGFHIFGFEQGFEQDGPTTVRSSHTESGKSHMSQRVPAMLPKGFWKVCACPPGTSLWALGRHLTSCQRTLRPPPHRRGRERGGGGATMNLISPPPRRRQFEGGMLFTDRLT